MDEVLLLSVLLDLGPARHDEDLYEGLVAVLHGRTFAHLHIYYKYQAKWPLLSGSE